MTGGGKGPRAFLVPELPWAGGVLALPSDVAHHMRVLRLGPGDDVELFTARGQRARATIRHLEAGEVECDVARSEYAPSTTRDVVLVQAHPKGSKLDTIVRSASELGVTSLLVVTSTRTVPQPDEDRAATRAKRLQRIAEEACKQCGRRYVPRVELAGGLLDAVKHAPAHAVKLVFWEDARTPLRDIAALRAPTDAPVWIVVGPEGGLTEGEVAALRTLGFEAVSLGPLVLRVDTAAIAALALTLAAARGDV